MSLARLGSVAAATWKNAMFVRREYGVRVVRQAADLWQLRSVGVGASDYFQYDLFDRSRFPDAASRMTYRGWRFSSELRRFSDRRIQALAYHKHILYRLLGSFGLPVPRIVALYSPRHDGFERNRALLTRDALATFLRTTDDLPLFGKPSNASHGFGARAFLERVADGIRLRSGQVLPVGEAVDWIHAAAERTGTYLLTELLEPPDYLREVAGPALPSVRFIVLVRNGVPEPFSAVMLFPKVGQDISNVRGFTTGSIVGHIHLSSGVIDASLGAMGPGMRSAPRHPDTGAAIEGLRLDGWDELVALVLQAARALSPFRMQHWDVALTSRGPVILEMNFIGDMQGPQLFGPPGIFSEQFRTFWETQRVW